MGENYIRDTLKIDEEKIAEFRNKILADNEEELRRHSRKKE